MGEVDKGCQMIRMNVSMGECASGVRREFGAAL